jgi:anti-anti-sigma regulatory factor
MTAAIDNAEIIQITDECTIYDVAQLKEQVQEVIERGESVCFDLSKVMVLDASVVQLLLSTKIELASRNLSFSISAMSDAAQAFINNIYCLSSLLKNSSTVSEGD